MINFELLMLMLLLSSFILIVIPSFLTILINKKIQLSHKHLSLGIIISVFTTLKLPFLSMTTNESVIKTTILGTMIYVLTESIVRYFLHRKESHQTINNMLSITLGYISLKFIAIFLNQMYSFTQLSVIATKYPEILSEILNNINLNILYLGQIYHSIYIVLYSLMLLFFILIEHQKVKSFYKYELLFSIINFIVILLITTINYLSTIPKFYPIYTYFNLFLILVFIIIILNLYQYCKDVNTSRT